MNHLASDLDGSDGDCVISMQNNPMPKCRIVTLGDRIK